MCFGATMELAGSTIQASILLGNSEPRLVTNPGLQLSGNLVAAGRLLFTPGTLSGQLRHDEHLECRETPPALQVKDTLLVVALSPTIRAKEVKRL